MSIQHHNLDNSNPNQFWWIRRFVWGLKLQLLNGFLILYFIVWLIRLYPTVIVVLHTRCTLADKNFGWSLISNDDKGDCWVKRQDWKRINVLSNKAAQEEFIQRSEKRDARRRAKESSEQTRSNAKKGWVMVRWLGWRRSREKYHMDILIDGSLLHDPKKLLNIDNTIIVLIEFINHGLKFIITECLTQLATNTS